MIVKSVRSIVFILNENYKHNLEETIKLLNKIAKFVIQDANIMELREDFTKDKFQSTISDAQVMVKACGMLV